jgi:peptidylprolyl isomerase
MTAQSGHTVRVHYTGTLSDHTVFDSSEGREPLEFALGAGQVIAGFDAAVTGMAVGDSKTVTIPAAEAYGAHDAENVIVVGREQIPPGAELSLGDQLEVGVQGGGRVMVRVTEMTDETVTLDGNHPLAGEDLTFALTLDEIVA